MKGKPHVGVPSRGSSIIKKDGGRGWQLVITVAWCGKKKQAIERPTSTGGTVGVVLLKSGSVFHRPTGGEKKQRHRGKPGRGGQLDEDKKGIMHGRRK